MIHPIFTCIGYFVIGLLMIGGIIVAIAPHLQNKYKEIL